MLIDHIHSETSWSLCQTQTPEEAPLCAVVQRLALKSSPLSDKVFSIFHLLSPFLPQYSSPVIASLKPRSPLHIKSVIHPSQSTVGESLTLLRQEQTESLLQSNTLPRPLVVRGEARRVRRLGDLAVGDLLEGVEAVAGRIEGVHKMHGGRFVYFSFVRLGMDGD